MHHRAGRGYLKALLHGFPSSPTPGAQIPAPARPATAHRPDLRGYGETDKPRHRDYTIQQIEADIVGLLDALGIDRRRRRPRLGAITWHLALAAPTVSSDHRPQRPLQPRGNVKPTDRFRAISDGRFNYILAFQPGRRREHGTRPPRLPGRHDAQHRRPEAIGDADLDVFAEAFARAACEARSTNTALTPTGIDASLRRQEVDQPASRSSPT
jgi:pimeloyl-ACP methyl ester carboxylesterase